MESLKDLSCVLTYFNEVKFLLTPLIGGFFAIYIHKNYQSKRLKLDTEEFKRKIFLEYNTYYKKINNSLDHSLFIQKVFKEATRNEDKPQKSFNSICIALIENHKSKELSEYYQRDELKK